MNRRALGTGKLRKRKQAGGTIWFADWTNADGSRERRVLSSDKTVAQRKLAAIIRERDLAVSGLAAEDGLDRLAKDVVVEFVTDLRARRSKRYADRVEYILALVTKELRVRTLGDFKPQAYMAFRRRRLQAGTSNRTANHELTVTRALLNWAVRVGYAPHNPLQGLEMLPAGRGYERAPRRALSEEEIGRFLVAASEIDREAAERALAVKSIAGGTCGRGFAERPRTPPIPQLPLWLGLLLTGARFTELVTTTWADLDEARGTLTLRASTTKSRRERVLPVRRELMDALGALRAAHEARLGRAPSGADLILLTPRGSAWIGNGPRALQRLRAVLERAGIPRVDARGEKVDIHSLRHTFASRLARNGVGLVQAQKLLGHSDPKLTASIYSHLDVEDLRGAVEGLPGLGTASGPCELATV